ncbi:acetyl-CoA carboxylase, carboxyltransferase subunit beta [Proteiniborus sp.]|uniref:acetyl-CoA carboxylase, carboxyltransferase subunit beta n=1 Tax=Proteiniborus sp. TaxID=2079015 RepID=UPI00332B2BB4
MLKDLFHKKKYASITLYKDDNNEKKHIKTEDLKQSLDMRIEDNEYPRIGARDRINELIDENTFIEYDVDLKSANPLNFPEYAEKTNSAVQKTGQNEAVITGEGRIMGESCIICVMEPNFMMGSMGSVVGEKITRAVEKATEKRLPVIIFSASGGARMQEGILSLMQMAKTSAALGKLSEEGLLYISVLTDPTTGGVTASFAMQGDIIISEPGALIGFAGPRVIEQTIRQKLPEGFQRAEFLLEKGFIDKIVHRKDMRNTLSILLNIHASGGEFNA